MSDPVLIALIAGAPGIITAINSFVNSAKLKKLQTVTDETSKNVNGRMSQMLHIQHEKSYLQGVSDAKKESQNEVQSSNVPS